MNIPSGRAAHGFVGREAELATLRTRLDGALAGSGGAVLLAGEAGIGKTRTAEELAVVAADRGMTVLWGRCTEGAGAPAFWPWVQILRAYARDRDPDTLRGELGADAAAVAQLVPEIRERLGGVPSPVEIDADQALFQLFDSVTTFLCTAARVRPLLLILDDLHWADTPSLRLLPFLARELAAAPILVIGAYRDLEVERGHPLATALAELVRIRGTVRIALRGLDELAVGRLLEDAFGVAAPPQLVAAVTHETEGNLFFITEIAHLLAAEGNFSRWADDGDSPQLAIPPTVREVIDRRLAGLSGPCNQALEVAAVIGREFPALALARVLASAPDRPASAEAAIGAADQLLTILEEAEQADLIAEAPGVLGSYRFVHVLFRETIYDGLRSTRRARLHRLVGDALADLYAADPTPHVAELAHHFLMAVPAGDAARAVAYCQQAGDHALALFSYAAAAEQYQNALRVLDLAQQGRTPSATPDQGAAPPVGFAERRCDLLLSLGDAQRLAGEMDAARTTFAEAATLARRLPSPERLAHAALGFGLNLFQVGQVDAALIELLEEALATMPPVDSSLRAMLLARLAMALYYSDAYERSLALGREALAMSERVGDPRTAAQVLHFQTMTSARRPVRERLATLDEFQRLARLTDSAALRMEALAWRAIWLWELGDAPAAANAIDAYSRMAEELRQPQCLHQTLVFRAAQAIQAGRFVEAQELAQQALALGRRAGRTDAVHVFGGQMMLLRLLQGLPGELEIPVRTLVTQAPGTPAWRCALAHLYAELGKDDEARAELERAFAHDLRDFPEDTAWLSSLTMLAAACTRLRDSKRATLLYDLLLPYAGQCVVVGGGIGFNGAVAHYLGLLAAALGRWDDAARHFETALATHARLDAPPWLAQTRYSFARTLLARGRADDRQRALELSRRAGATAEELGMARLTEQCRRLLDRGAPAPPVGNLTEREIDVLRLIVRGATTAAIAAELFRSIATVERHITNIYAKIGAHNRAEATTWALSHGVS